MNAQVRQTLCSYLKYHKPLHFPQLNELKQLLEVIHSPYVI